MPERQHLGTAAGHHRLSGGVLGGGERDPETPISVVGASIIGGDAFERGLYLAFWFFLA